MSIVQCQIHYLEQLYYAAVFILLFKIQGHYANY